MNSEKSNYGFIICVFLESVFLDDVKPSSSQHGAMRRMHRMPLPHLPHSPLSSYWMPDMASTET